MQPVQCQSVCRIAKTTGKTEPDPPVPIYLSHLPVPDPRGKEMSARSLFIRGKLNPGRRTGRSRPAALRKRGPPGEESPNSAGQCAG